MTVLLFLTADARAHSRPPQTGDTQSGSQRTSSDRVAVPEPTEQAKAYHRSGNVLWVLDTAWALVLPALLLWTGLSARMRDWARRAGRYWFFTVAL